MGVAEAEEEVSERCAGIWRRDTVVARTGWEGGQDGKKERSERWSIEVCSCLDECDQEVVDGKLIL